MLANREGSIYGPTRAENIEEGVGVVFLGVMGNVFLLLAQSFLASMHGGWRLQMRVIVW